MQEKCRSYTSERGSRKLPAFPTLGVAIGSPDFEIIGARAMRRQMMKTISLKTKELTLYFNNSIVYYRSKVETRKGTDQC
jgi:hypothetical protein